MPGFDFDEAVPQLLGAERELVENVGSLFGRLKETGVAPVAEVTRSNLFSSFLTYNRAKFRGDGYEVEVSRRKSDGVPVTIRRIQEDEAAA